MLKLLFEYLTSPYSLVENPLYDWVLLGVIGAIAFVISFRIVGWMYEEYIITGSGTGSFFHWTIRFFIFIALHYIVATGMKVYAWIVCVPAYIWWCAVGTMAGVIGLFMIWHYSRKKRVVVKVKSK
jgi:hypothetical protein